MKPNTTKLIVLLSTTIILTVSFINLYANPPADKGQDIYDRKCDRCHGEDGSEGKKGAENLQKSTMTDAEIIKIVTDGKRKMPAFASKLSEEDIKAVTAYIKTLRK